MQRLDVEQPAHALSDSSTICYGRKVPLRKYSIAMCLIEAMLIFVLLYILVRQPDLSTSSIWRVDGHEKQDQLNASTFVVRFTSDARSARFIPGLVHDCNQRKHDLHTSVVCGSRRAHLCRPVEVPEEPVDSASGASFGNLTAFVVTTSRAGGRLSSKHIKLRPVTDCGEPSGMECKFKTTLTVTPGKTYQKVVGFGGALTDSSINNILSLTTNGTMRLLNDYFGSTGLRFNMIRITIGGSDFSARFYTNDDSPFEDDLPLRNFQLRFEDHLYKIPLLKLIQQTYTQTDEAGIKVFASMWSPPVWMKTNNHFNKGYLRGSAGGTSNGSDRNDFFYDTLARLKVKFLESYLDNGVRLWGLTVMNEPIFAVQPFLDFNTMIFPRQDYAHYLGKYLGPKIRGHRRLGHLRLMVHDDNRRFLETFTLPLLTANMSAYIDGVSTHGYVDEDYQMNDEIERRLQQMGLRQAFVLPDELCSGHLPFMAKALVGNWHRGVHYALDIIRNLQHSAAGWVDWNMALDTSGGPGWLGGRLDAPIIVDKAADVYHKSPMFYVLGQFSRYIPPGARKVHTTIVNDLYDSHFETVTFLEPAGLNCVTVVVNNNPYAIELDLVVSKRYRLSVEADSVTTFVYSARL